MSEYDIITNLNGRRILVVNQLVNIIKRPELTFKDFDAIFINITHVSYEENRLAVRWTSPIRNPKCFLKPRFASSALKSYLQAAVNLMDGFCSSPFDTVFTNYIETVYETINKFNFNKEMVIGKYSTVSNLINFIKFDISRGRTTFTNTTATGLAEGFNKLFVTWYDNQETLQLNERKMFLDRIEKLGYAVKDHFVDRIHLCPDCGHSHLLFREACPKCGSSSLSQEGMIHHFRCANVSPESTYQYDGQLRCPKCKQFLHHIGVDYDRPASIYLCGGCGNHFISSVMKVKCNNCGNETSPERLRALDVWNYRYTSKGITAFASNEALFQVENQSIFSGYSKVSEMQNVIKEFPTMRSYRGYVMVLLRYYLGKYNSDNSPRLFELIRIIVMRITTVRIAHDGNDLYVLLLSTPDVVNSNASTVASIMQQLFTEYASMGKSFGAVMLKQYMLTQEEDPEKLLQAMTEPIHISQELAAKAI